MSVTSQAVSNKISWLGQKCVFIRSQFTAALAGTDNFYNLHSTKLMLHNVICPPSTLMIGEATTLLSVVLSSVAKLLKV